MKKSTNKIISMIAIAIVCTGIMAACSPANASAETQQPQQPVERRTSSEKNSREKGGITQELNVDLTETEIEGLHFMREEEKLASDVYAYFYDLWGNTVFQNIAASEDMHTQSVLSLMNQFGISDTTSAEDGVFQIPELQTLYDQLTTQGSQSLQEALMVGAAIEEIDILDLEKYIQQTENAEIRQVYQNLAAGSESHLQAFVRVLQNQGSEDYQPQYLSQEAYDQIIQGSSMGNGNGRGLNGKGQDQGQGKGQNRDS